MSTQIKLLPALIALSLAGCASQQAQTGPDQPMQDRLAALELAISTTDRASQSRDAALSREIDGLRSEVRTLSDRLATQGEQSNRLDGRLTQAEQRLDGLSASVKEALALATQENIRINGKEAFTVSLTEDKTLYPINSPELGSQDAGKLDDLVGRLAKMDQEYHLEIQGHTDNIGTDDYNYELGKARADVVKRYLHEKKGVSLSRMSVISFGAANPVDRNSNHNRRILIRVLVLDKNDKNR